MCVYAHQPPLHKPVEKLKQNGSCLAHTREWFLKQNNKKCPKLSTQIRDTWFCQKK
jgi:hypothetical protein